MKRSDRALIKKVVLVPGLEQDKYSRGVLGVITGSKRYPGAAVLTNKAAQKTGVGMIRFYSKIKQVNYLVLEKNPETVTQKGQVQAWLLGSGITPDGDNFFTRRKLNKAINQGLSQVLDAGALYLAGKQTSPTIITPHYQELARLFENNSINVSVAEIRKDPEKWAKKAAQEFGVTVLLKGNLSVITDGKKVVKIKSLTTFLATSGTGDVLAGILGALVATNYLRIRNKTISLIEIAQCACLIHQFSALESSQGGPISASMIIERIPSVIGKAISR
jgi:ADP-dependent NAD(P)H-hydrate dehydratase / NAD(P)H-hydrate epimerase